jgi:hypothetical protein
MRSLCSGLAAAILAGPLVVLGVGCGGGASDLEKPVDTTKQMDPMRDMPGFKETQEKLKAQGKK